MNFYIKIFGWVIILASSITFFIIFMSAFFNNGILVINVNKYGEGIYEFVSLIIGLPIGIYLIYKVLDTE